MWKPKVPSVRPSVRVGGLASDTFSVIHNAGFLTAITLNIAITSQLRITNAIENAFNRRQIAGERERGRVMAHTHI